MNSLLSIVRNLHFFNYSIPDISIMDEEMAKISLIYDDGCLHFIYLGLLHLNNGDLIMIYPIDGWPNCVDWCLIRCEHSRFHLYIFLKGKCLCIACIHQIVPEKEISEHTIGCSSFDQRKTIPLSHSLTILQTIFTLPTNFPQLLKMILTPILQSNLQVSYSNHRIHLHNKRIATLWRIAFT